MADPDLGRVGWRPPPCRRTALLAWAAGARRIRRARLRLEAATDAVRSGRVPARERPLPRLHVGVSGALPGSRRAARRAPAPGTGAATAESETVRRLPRRILVRPSRCRSRLCRIRRRRTRRTDLLLLADAARVDAHRPGDRSAQRPRRRRAPRTVQQR